MVASVVVLGILLGTIAVTAAVAIAGKRTVQDASNDDQESVSRRAWTVLIPVTLFVVAGSQVAFALISHAFGVGIESPRGFMLYMGVWGVACVPIMVLAAVYGRRYQNARSSTCERFVIRKR